MEVRTRIENMDLEKDEFLEVIGSDELPGRIITLVYKDIEINIHGDDLIRACTNALNINKD